MSVSKVAIIYSEALKTRRAVIVADFDAQYAAFKDALRPGEGWLEMPIETYQQFITDAGTPDVAIDDYLAGVIGPALDDTCSIVAQDGIVLAKVRADKSIDAVPTGTLVKGAMDVGDRYDVAKKRVVAKRPEFASMVVTGYRVEIVAPGKAIIIPEGVSK